MKKLIIISLLLIAGCQSSAPTGVATQSVEGLNCENGMFIRAGDGGELRAECAPNSPLPTPTGTPPGSITLCREHDPTNWHPLFDAATNCHYNHEHKDDPHLVGDVFGLVAALYGGQEISYPWQTFKGAGEGFPRWDGDPNTLENAAKHEGYGWIVRKDIECSSRFSNGCLTDFRLQYHAIFSSVGAVTRFHSYWVEARGCREDNPDVCGIIRMGGWQDFGYLLVDNEHVPLPGDPAKIVSGFPRKLHHTGVVPGAKKNFATWYGKSSTIFQPVKVDIALQTSRAWGVVFADSPTELHLFCPDNQCENPKLSNGSNIQAHLIAIKIASSLDKDGDGLADFEGFTNRYGKIVNGCTEVGLDCIPLQITGMPVGGYQYRDDSHQVGGEFGNGLTYDDSPPGEYWITYPN